jgi:hypothetical protein
MNYLTKFKTYFGQARPPNSPSFSVFYDGQRRAVFDNEVDAIRHVRRELRDPNADKNKFSIKQD